jgi:M6 family metalloprotease-like protein
MRLRTRSTLTAAALAAALGTQAGLATSSSAAPTSDSSVSVRVPGTSSERTALPRRTVVDDTRRTVTGTAARALSRQVVGPTYPVLVIPVYFSNTAANNASKEESAALLAHARSWYSTVSGGRFTLQPTVTEPLRVQNSCADAGDDKALAGLTESATAAARGKGFDSRKYAATMIMHPDCAFGWEGVATWSITAGKSVHTVLLDGPGGRAKNVVVHELGHTLRLDHANLSLCDNGTRYLTAAVNSSSACDSYVYEDSYDTMGNNSKAGSFSGANLSALGWLSPSQLATRSSGTTRTRLTTLESGSGVRVIKVRANAKVTYWIEYRRRSGVDAKIPAAGVGVQIRRTEKTAENDEADEYLPATDLIDMAPQSMDLNVLPSGASWTSPEGVNIRVGTQSSSAAWIKVRFKAPKPRTPSAPALRLTSGTGSLTARWNAPADHGRPVGSYRLYVYNAGGKRVRTLDLNTTTV